MLKDGLLKLEIWHKPKYQFLNYRAILTYFITDLHLYNIDTEEMQSCGREEAK
jgi:hypothetical protein